MIPPPRDGPQTFSLLERALAVGALFYGGVAFCLPVAFTEDIAVLYPWWGKRIAIGNIQLYELFFLAWLVLYGSFVMKALLNRGVPVRQAALSLVALAVWCGLISMFAPLPLLDVGRTLRLMLNVALVIAVVRWTRRSMLLPLVALVVGFLIGSLINLFLSFKYPFIVLGTMRLSGQNTPGVAMGVAIHLCAWLFYRADRSVLRIFAVVATGVFTFGCAISFSRIGWFAGALGLGAWFYVMFLARPREREARRRLMKVRGVLAPALAAMLVYFFASPLGQESLVWVQALVNQKTEGRASESNANRWTYVIGTAEILSRQPFGVGYSGFYDAMTSTDAYRSGTAVEEESPESANPHAAFLWYAAAGGIPGAVLAVTAFVLFLRSMQWGLISAMGAPGFILFVLAAFPFLLIGLTVTYLLNSFIFIVPAAIAASWGWTHVSKVGSKSDLPPAYALPS